MHKETKEERNLRREGLYGQIGAAIGPIVEQHTLINRARAIDCIDCLIAHSIGILAIYYEWPKEKALEAQKTVRDILVNFSKKKGIGNGSISSSSDKID